MVADTGGPQVNQLSGGEYASGARQESGWNRKASKMISEKAEATGMVCICARGRYEGASISSSLLHNSPSQQSTGFTVSKDTRMRQGQALRFQRQTEPTNALATYASRWHPHAKACRQQTNTASVRMYLPYLTSAVPHGLTGLSNADIR